MSINPSFHKANNVKHLVTCLLEGEAYRSGQLEASPGISLADRQDVIYEDKEHLDRVLGKLRKLPPLVSPVEVRHES
jgi:hypothetical protein